MLKKTGIFGTRMIGIGPAWMSMGGLSISPIGQLWDPEMVASRLAVAFTEAEADRDTPLGMAKWVWISADSSTWASRLTWPETGPLLTPMVLVNERPTLTPDRVRTPAAWAWKVDPAWASGSPE